MTLAPSIAPPATVEAPARTPLPYGLFSVVTFRGDSDRWQSGVQYQQGTCDPADAIGPFACTDGETVGLPKNLAANGGELVQASQFTVYGHYSCSIATATEQEMADWAVEHLTSREEAAVEHALWTGDLGNVPFVTDPAAVTDLTGGTAVGLVSALAALEQHVATDYGSVGVIHVSRTAALRLLAADVVSSSGGRLTTLLGTPVVAGTGYLGTGPDGSAPADGQTWIYATPPLVAYRSEIFGAGVQYDTGTNDATAVAERNYLVSFGTCGHAAALATLNTSGGSMGPAGPSAYEVAVNNGFEGTETEWLASLEGTDGTDGSSAYEVAVANGFSGTETEWLASLEGPQGPKGDPGEGVPAGGATGDHLTKTSGTDYDTEWSAPV